RARLMLPKKKKAVSKKRAPRKRAERAAQEFSVSGVELRDYQAAVLTRLNAGILRQMLIWHRRAGKDISMLEIARIKMQERVGVYWHMFPKHVQAKRALWTGIDARDGKRFIQRAFEPAGVVAANQVDMLIELECGSTWQLLGSDNYDRAIGANVCGVVFSEWALCDPRAWEFIRPILAENGGWAIFISTYRGRNHC